METANPPTSAPGSSRVPEDSLLAPRALFWAAFATSVALRAVYLLDPSRVDLATFPMFLSDEGASGLMARHILQGTERPVFYYGGYYHGALDAYIAALSFRLFGESLFSLRLVPSLFSIACIPLAFFLGRRIGGTRAGLLAGALAALPSNYVFEWGTLALCSYCGYVAYVLLCGLLTAKALERGSPARLGVLGLVSGLATWSNQLQLAYLAVSGAALHFWGSLDRKKKGLLLAAFLVGVSPLLYGNVIHPLATVRQLGRKAYFSLTLAKRYAAEDESERSYRSYPLLQVLGAQPTRDGKFSLPGSLGAVVLSMGFLGTGVSLWRRRRRSGFPRAELLVFGLAFAALFLGLPGWTLQPIGRYQLPLYPLLAILTACWLVRSAPRLAIPVTLFVLLVRAGTLAFPPPHPQRTPIEKVIAVLLRHDLHEGYSAGQMYHVSFRSGEAIALVDLGHSRYAAYEERVENAGRIFYLFREDQVTKPAHQVFLSKLAAREVRYRVLRLGEYHILHDFEPRSAIDRTFLAEVRAEFRRRKRSAAASDAA
ncbi:MAG: hypothetical protein KatS3mg076_2266 [Candidatus Binatia bacterium]|nr:MAG: hypothetical protein KatS3mg076_2266 [Candidatus Binatia bacterium]